MIDENRMIVTPKMTLIETFCGGTMYTVHIEVASLVYKYVYVGSKTIFPCKPDWIVFLNADGRSELKKMKKMKKRVKLR